MRTRTRAGLVTGLLAATTMGTAPGDDVHRMMSLAKLDIVRAIEIATKETGGALVVYIELKEKSDLPVYEAKALSDESRYELLIDGQTGAVKNSKTKKLRERHRKIRTDALRMGVSLTDGLPYLESKKPGAVPYRMEFDTDYDVLIYKFRLLGGEKKYEFQARYAQGAMRKKPSTRKPVEAPAEPPVAKAAEPPAKPAEKPVEKPMAPAKIEPEEAPPRVKVEAVTWNFDDVASANEGWRAAETRATKSLATWEVVKDETAPSQPNVMALTHTENYNGTFNIAVQENATYANIDLSVKVKGVSGEEDQGGGPLWRCTDENNYYVCRFNPLEDNFRLYKVIDGKRKQLATVKVETEPGKWYTIRVTMIDFEIACYLDGKKLLEAEDAALTEAGVIGLWTKADAVTSFDDLTVKPPKE